MNIDQKKIAQAKASSPFSQKLGMHDRKEWGEKS